MECDTCKWWNDFTKECHTPDDYNCCSYEEYRPYEFSEIEMKEHDKQIRKELINKMKSRFFHMVGTEFDNAIIEMERLAENMK